MGKKEIFFIYEKICYRDIWQQCFALGAFIFVNLYFIVLFLSFRLVFEPFFSSFWLLRTLIYEWQILLNWVISNEINVFSSSLFWMAQ